MTHLGGRVSALVDGRLSVDAAERALVHLASCAACRRDVAAERAVRRMLAATEPAAPDDLTSSLLALGGQHGPLAPRHPVLPSGPGPGTGGPAGAPTGGVPADPARSGGDVPAPWLAVDPPSAVRGGTPRHAVRLPSGRRARVAAGGSAAVLATGVLGVGLLGALPASSATAAPPALGAATSPAADTTAVLVGRTTAAAGAFGATTPERGLWDHVVRGTRVMCVLVTGS